MRKARAVALEFDGKWFRTIGDVTKEFKTSVKKIESLVADGTLPNWSVELQGTRKFRHFDDEWMTAARKYFDSLRA